MLDFLNYEYKLGTIEDISDYDVIYMPSTIIDISKYKNTISYAFQDEILEAVLVEMPSLVIRDSTDIVIEIKGLLFRLNHRE